MSIEGITLPEGEVLRITASGSIIWEGFPAKEPLSNMSWEDIAKVCKAGKASEYWSVGDQRNLSIGGTTYKVRIIGFDHDNVTSAADYGRAKAGATFQLVDCYNTKYAINSSASNTGGWDTSNMRTATLQTLFNSLPSAVKSACVAVNKVTTKGNKSTTTKTSSDKLFLLSDREISGESTSPYSKEGSRYAFYGNGGSAVKKVGSSNSSWWTRSADYSSTANFINVNVNGSASSSDFRYPSTNKANTSLGVSFAFCL